ncbi:hypothetical protein [Aphanothece sacrum]|uniref:ATPase n=1 Tax=Aphanothece sacrum FPU1 TaxID=1920663 RepID=A0A401IME2_APHSA|nr:hypothetical protein [Aphanothece sacrum]GBF82422.1 ATPase [Aphanothece sacrum FPU1]GBF84423.1 ATPase [Aphanothece sacrum FPU3]
MTYSDPNRLDRIEALIEANARAIEALGKRVDSNARAIEALTNNMVANQQEAQRDRARFYQAMADLALSQVQMAETHAQFQSNIYQRHEALDQRQDELSRRQQDIVEILKLLTNQFKNDN